MKLDQINHNKSLLFDAVYSNLGIQHIVDVATQIFNNPIVVADIANSVLAKTANHTFYGISDEDSSQPAVLSEVLMDLTRRNRLSQQFRLNDRQILITEPCPGKRYCLCLIRVRSTIVAHLAICQEWTAIREDIFPLVEMLAKVLALELQKGNNNLMMGFASSRLFLLDLLEKRLTTRSAIQQRLDNLNWNPNADFCLVIIPGNGEPLSQLMLQNTINFLKPIFPNNLCALTEAGIVLLASTSRNEGFANVDFQILEDYLTDCGLRCGISNVFYDLLNVPAAYSQALSALEISQKFGNTNPIFRFSDYYYFSILDLCSNKFDLRSLCMPTMLLLREHDKSHTTPLIPTLKAFLDHALDYNHTAQALYIHRNTLNYRLTKIKSILCLDSFSGTNLQHILLTLRIFEYLDTTSRSHTEE